MLKSRASSSNHKKYHAKPQPKVEEITEDEIAQFVTEDGLPIYTLYVSGFKNYLHPVTVQTLMHSFQADGPIKKVVIHDAKVPYAFVTFADVKSALMAKRTHHFFNGKKLILRPADSWHQPEDNREASESEEEIDMYQSILKLNDDCLYCVLSYFNLRELIVIEKVCRRFQAVVQRIYKTYRTLDFDKLADTSQLTLMEVRNITRRMGAHVVTLKATATSFRTINPRIIVTILRHCRNLQSIHLEGFNMSSMLALRELSQTCGNLKVFQLPNCSVTDEIVTCLHNARELETLSLAENSGIIGKCLTGLRKIKEINLSSCPNLQPSYFMQFCERNPELKSLNIIRCDKINHICLETMARHLKSLESLMICNSYASVTPADYVVLVDMPNLTHLQISYNNYLNVDTFLAKLADLNRLDYLDISGGHITRNTLRALTNFRKLRVLKLNYKIECVDDTLAQISSNETIQELHIVSCTSITNEGLVAFIRKCRQLRHINMSGCYGITNDLVINILPHLAERPEILELVVGGTQITIGVEEHVNAHENPKLKLDYTNTAEAFGAIDIWEDMLYGDDLLDMEDIDDEDLDDDAYAFFHYENGYDSEFDEDELFV
ncbi:putative RNA-binding protein EEED8.10 [Lutzomyia longipalpis]|uniref:Rna-binding protein n=2 Tax=Lutzomyia longipalpis TaxID=7200 RepID=A0A1B0CDB6_LUTLO|nr:putative RNA-binding protein EEED8.10 [Lutzomyia longipalpis]